MSMKLKSSGIQFNVPDVSSFPTENLEDNLVCVVTDENRGGTFVYRSAESAINNGGTVFNGWTRQYDGAVNVKWFGAAGDGINIKDFNSESDFNTFVSTQTYTNSTGLRVMSNFVVGAKALPHTASKRDAIQVSRDINGATDCHGFADKTDMQTVSDYGGYCPFDNTVKVGGTHSHNHVYGFQDRTEYYGTGTIANIAGLYSYPKLTSTGTISLRRGIDIYDINNTGGGTITTQYGVRIQDLNAAINNFAIYAEGDTPSYHGGNIGVGVQPNSAIKLYVNGGSGAGDVGLNISKTDGYAIYTSGTGKSTFSGRVEAKTDIKVGTTIGVGINPVSSTILAGKVTDSHPGSVFLSTDSTSAALGNTADGYIRFVTNGSTRLELTNIANFSTFRPGTDNFQYLGDATKRWKQLYAGTTTIATSDIRYKEQIEDLDTAEKAVAIKLKASIKKFKFKDAVVEKGTDARIHIGVMAQEVVEIFASEGLDATKYALLCHDEWEENGEVKDIYGIRYEELLAFIISAM